MNFRKVIETYGYPVISKEVSQVIYYARRAIKTGRADTSYAIKQLNGEYINPKTGTTSPFFNKRKWRWLLDAPFDISSNCCNVMKKNTVHRFESKTKLKPIIGTMAAESKLRTSQWLNSGCNAFDGKYPNSKPMSFWTEQDVLEYIRKYKLDYCSAYGDIIEENGKLKTSGLSRTGCMFCAYGAHLEKEPNRFQRLKETHPTVWNYCMKPWDEGGLGMKEVLDYIGVKTE